MSTSLVTVVVATRDRRDALLRTAARLVSLDVPVIVVGNGSTDGSMEALRADQPCVRVVRLEENVGAAARNIGVELARTPYVALPTTIRRGRPEVSNARRRYSIPSPRARSSRRGRLSARGAARPTVGAA